MVGVDVAMMVSTMREKSCIDLHNARKFEKKKFQNSVIHISRNPNDGITKVESLGISYVILTIRHNYPESYFLQNGAGFVFEIWLI